MLIITVNTRIPYLYDIPLILGYPKSFRQRFRFKDKWLPSQLSLNSFFKGEKGLILLREESISQNIYSQGEKSINPFHVPIRFFTLIDVTQVDNMYFFDVALGDIPDFGIENGSDGLERIENNKKFNKSLIKDLPPIDLTKDPKQHQFVYFIQKWEPYQLFFPISSNTEETNWGFIINVLIKYSKYQNIQFLKVISCLKQSSNINLIEDWVKRSINKLRGKKKRKVIFDNDGFAVSRNLMQYIDEEKGGFKIGSSKTYYIDILQKLEHSEKNKEKLNKIHQGDLDSFDELSLSEINALPYEIHLNSKSKDVSVTSSIQIAVGEYDRIRYLIRLNNVQKTSDVLLELRAKRKNEGPYNQPFFLPVVIKARKARRTLGAGMFLLFALITGGMDDLAPWLDLKFGLELSNSFIENIQMVGLFGVVICISILIYKTDITKIN